MIKVSDEVKLVTALIGNRKPVPENLRAKALEDLKLLSMATDSEAVLYMLDELTKAIEDLDAERLDDLDKITMAATGETLSAGNEERSGLSRENFTEELAGYYDAAIDAFVEVVGDERIAFSILDRLIGEVKFVPLLCEDGMLFGWSNMYGSTIVFGINFDGSKTKLSDRFSKIDRAGVCKALGNALRSSLQMQFGVIMFQSMGDGMTELVIRGL